tara:strand:+ start:22 stop:225 length:204 start_codon:yes stop_codon:yes gene_type:complete
MVSNYQFHSKEFLKMQHDNELTTYETNGGGIFRLVGAPDKPSVLNTGSFKKSKLTKKELKELNIKDS